MGRRPSWWRCGDWRQRLQRIGTGGKRELQRLAAHAWGNETRSLRVSVVDPTRAEPWVPGPPAWVEKDRKRTGMPVHSYSFP